MQTSTKPFPIPCNKLQTERSAQSATGHSTYSIALAWPFTDITGKSNHCDQRITQTPFFLFNPFRYIIVFFIYLFDIIFFPLNICLSYSWAVNIRQLNKIVYFLTLLTLIKLDIPFFREYTANLYIFIPFYPIYTFLIIS